MLYFIFIVLSLAVFVTGLIGSLISNDLTQIQIKFLNDTSSKKLFYGLKYATISIFIIFLIVIGLLCKAWEIEKNNKPLEKSLTILKQIDKKMDRIELKLIKYPNIYYIPSIKDIPFGENKK